MLSAHAHNIEYYGLVKVVNNASGTYTCLAGSYLQAGMQSPIESDVRYLSPTPSLDLVQRERERESVVFWLISPKWGLIQPSSSKSRSIDCTMCVRGMCSIEL